VHVEHAGDLIRVAGPGVAVAAQGQDDALGRERVQEPPERRAFLPRNVEALLELPG
jgi:hypothetical protein